MYAGMLKLQYRTWIKLGRPPNSLRWRTCNAAASAAAHAGSQHLQTGRLPVHRAEQVAGTGLSDETAEPETRHICLRIKPVAHRCADRDRRASDAGRRRRADVSRRGVRQVLRAGLPGRAQGAAPVLRTILIRFSVRPGQAAHAGVDVSRRKRFTRPPGMP